MPRRVQDIVPSTRRSIRSVPVEKPRTEDIKRPRESKRVQDTKPVVDVKFPEPPPMDRMPFTPPVSEKKARRGKWKYLIALIVVVVIVVVAYILSIYFSHATFTLVPKVVPVSVDSTYVAEDSSANGDLSYDIVTLSSAASTTVTASNGQAVAEKAQGKITIFNSFGTDSQRLVAGTRIANDTGRVYRLSGSVVVPGYTIAAGNKVPGSVSSAIVADQAGETYNIFRSDPQSDFHVLAFKDTPRNAGFYARLTTDITGGFSGTKKTVAQPVLASTTVELQARITSSLAAKAKGSVPAGSILYDDADVMSFSAPQVSGSTPDKATVTIQGTLSAVTFKKAVLIDRIVGDKASVSFGNGAYTSPGLETLVLTIANPKDFSPDKKNTLIIKLKGAMKLIGTIPVDEIKKQVAGMALSATQKVLERYSSVIDINKSGGEVVPPWAKVPSDESRISVVVQGD